MGEIRSSIPELRTAYHEAAHAVIGVLHGGHCSAINLQPTRSVLAWAGTGWWLPDDPGRVPTPLSVADRERVDALVKAMLAGGLAEYIHTGRHWPEQCRSDHEQARRWIPLLALDVEAQFKRAETAVLEELRQPTVWEHVEALAARLMEKPILLGADLQSFFEGRALTMQPPSPAR
jgi:hypothetical protein